MFQPMESPESQLSNLLFFVEFWLNLVIFVEFSNQDLRFIKLHENHEIPDFTCKNAPKIKDFAIFMEFGKSEVPIRIRCLGTFVKSKSSKK